MSTEPKLQLLLSPDEIQKAVARLARHIERDYQGKQPLLVGILKGAFVFLADLIRQLSIPVEVDFVRVASYGPGTESSGQIKFLQRLRTPLRGRHVLVVEDIVDTGLSLSFLLDYLGRKRPVSLKLCALADKPERRRVPLTIDYLGFTVPDKFLVGYGLDWDENYRHLPGIYTLEEASSG